MKSIRIAIVALSILSIVNTFNIRDISRIQDQQAYSVDNIKKAVAFLRDMAMMPFVKPNKHNPAKGTLL